jgi:hypothetical protein
MVKKFLDLGGAQVLWNNAKAKFGVSLDYGSYNGVDNCIMLKNDAGDVLDYIDAGVFLKDSMLSSVEYDSDSKVFTFTWNTTEAGEDAGKTVVSLEGLIDTYEPGDKLSLTDGKFSHVKEYVGGYTKATEANITLNGSGQTGSFTIPTLTVNEYGHVTNVGEQTVSITLPTVTETVEIPAALPNPHALTLNVNGNPVVYDGSTAQEVNFNCTDEKTTFAGHYTPENGNNVSVSESKASADGLTCVTGIAFDAKGHVTNVNLQAVEFTFATKDDVDAICL